MMSAKSQYLSLSWKTATLVLGIVLRLVFLWCHWESSVHCATYTLFFIHTVRGWQKSWWWMRGGEKETGERGRDHILNNRWEGIVIVRYSNGVICKQTSGAGIQLLRHTFYQLFLILFAIRVLHTYLYLLILSHQFFFSVKLSRMIDY